MNNNPETSSNNVSYEDEINSSINDSEIRSSDGKSKDGLRNSRSEKKNLENGSSDDDFSYENGSSINDSEIRSNDAESKKPKGKKKPVTGPKSEKKPRTRSRKKSNAGSSNEEEGREIRSSDDGGRGVLKIINNYIHPEKKDPGKKDVGIQTNSKLPSDPSEIRSSDDGVRGGRKIINNYIHPEKKDSGENDSEIRSSDAESKKPKGKKKPVTGPKSEKKPRTRSKKKSNAGSSNEEEGREIRSNDDGGRGPGGGDGGRGPGNVSVPAGTGPTAPAGTVTTVPAGPVTGTLGTGVGAVGGYFPICVPHCNSGNYQHNCNPVAPLITEEFMIDLKDPSKYPEVPEHDWSGTIVVDEYWRELIKESDVTAIEAKVSNIFARVLLKRDNVKKEHADKYNIICEKIKKSITEDVSSLWKGHHSIKDRDGSNGIFEKIKRSNADLMRELSELKSSVIKDSSYFDREKRKLLQDIDSAVEVIKEKEDTLLYLIEDRRKAKKKKKDDTEKYVTGIGNGDEIKEPNYDKIDSGDAKKFINARKDYMDEVAGALSENIAKFGDNFKAMAYTEYSQQSEKHNEKQSTYEIAKKRNTFSNYKKAIKDGFQKVMDNKNYWAFDFSNDSKPTPENNKLVDGIRDFTTKIIDSVQDNLCSQDGRKASFIGNLGASNSPTKLNDLVSISLGNGDGVIDVGSDFLLNNAAVVLAGGVKFNFDVSTEEKKKQSDEYFERLLQQELTDFNNDFKGNFLSLTNTSSDSNSLIKLEAIKKNDFTTKDATALSRELAGLHKDDSITSSQVADNFNRQLKMVELNTRIDYKNKILNKIKEGLGVIGDDKKKASDYAAMAQKTTNELMDLQMKLAELKSQNEAKKATNNDKESRKFERFTYNMKNRLGQQPIL